MAFKVRPFAMTRTPDPLHENIPPVIQEIDFKCPGCRDRHVDAVMTAYPDAIYVQCRVVKAHHYTFYPTEQLPTWRDWLAVEFVEDPSTDRDHFNPRTQWEERK
jgi:hypothetical protein